jgi:hypothetical protein
MINEYRCLWLDSTAGGGLAVPTSQGTGGNNEIVFLFKGDDRASSIHTTFTYNKATDTWNWLIDNESGSKLTSFARVELSRK